MESFNKLTADNVEWEALLLMGTCAVAYEPLDCGFARDFRGRSAAAYMVTRKYVASLLGCFAESTPSGG